MWAGIVSRKSGNFVRSDPLFVEFYSETGPRRSVEVSVLINLQLLFYAPLMNFLRKPVFEVSTVHRRHDYVQVRCVKRRITG